MCWLLVASIGKNRPVRTPRAVSCSLPIPHRKCTIESIHLLIFTKGNGHCAWDSYLHEAVDRRLSSIALPSLRRLVQTRHRLAPAGDANRPFPKQVRAFGRKRTPASATHHSAPTGETTCLYQDGPLASGFSGQDSPELETSPHHCPARDAPTLASKGASSSTGNTSPEQHLLNLGFLQRLWP